MKRRSLLLILLIVLLLTALFPAYVIFRNLYHDYPLRNYLKEKITRDIPAEFDAFLTSTNGFLDSLDRISIQISSSGIDSLESEIKTNLIQSGESGVRMGTNHWQYVAAKLQLNQDSLLSISIRIRGDMSSNFNQGIEKSSFRFNAEQLLYNKRKWSLLPIDQEYNRLYNPLYYDFCKKEGIIRPEIHFVLLEINGDDAGLYILQEGLSTSLTDEIALSKGIILRFLNDCSDPVSGAYNEDLIPTLEAYEMQQLKKDSTLINLYNIIQQRFLAVFNGKISLDKVFEVNSFSKFCAINEVFMAHHSLLCQNTKFYLNPKDTLLYPIAWDPASYMNYGNTINADIPHHNYRFAAICEDERRFPIPFLLAKDQKFMEGMHRYLQDLTSGTEFTRWFEQKEKDYLMLHNYIVKHYPNTLFKSEWLMNNLTYIREKEVYTSSQ